MVVWRKNVKIYFKLLILNDNLNFIVCRGITTTITKLVDNLGYSAFMSDQVRHCECKVRE